MMAEHVEVHYEQMASIAQAFDQQGQEVENMLRAVANQVETLRSGVWIGKGADAFVSEMDNEVLPALNRLLAALQHAADVSRAVAYEFGEAEQETVRLLAGPGAAMDQAGDHVGNYNFKVEIEGGTAASQAIPTDNVSFNMAKVEFDNNPGSQKVYPKVEGNPAADAAQKVYGGPDSVGGNQSFKVEGNPASSQASKFPDMPGGGGGGSTPPTNVPNVTKFQNPPAPFTPSMPGGQPDVAKFPSGDSPGGPSGLADGAPGSVFGSSGSPPQSSPNKSLDSNDPGDESVQKV